jgi:hypothetical protein
MNLSLQLLRHLEYGIVATCQNVEDFLLLETEYINITHIILNRNLCMYLNHL